MLKFPFENDKCVIYRKLGQIKINPWRWIIRLILTKFQGVPYSNNFVVRNLIVEYFTSGWIQYQLHSFEFVASSSSSFPCKGLLQAGQQWRTQQDKKRRLSMLCSWRWCDSWCCMSLRKTFWILDLNFCWRDPVGQPHLSAEV